MKVFLFHELTVRRSDGVSVALGTPTTRSLFAYLLLHRQHPRDRRRLAFLFWPDAAESAARRNLRQYLFRLKRALEPLDPQGDLLLADNSSVQINPQADLWIDAEEFRACLLPGSDTQSLRSAVALYRGDLLEDIYDDWCAQERQDLRQLYLHALDQLIMNLQHQGALEEALRYARQWVHDEPLNEAAHRRLMALLSLSGNRGRAIEQYEQMAETLATTLDTDPMPESKALYEAIKQGAYQAPGDQPGAAEIWSGAQAGLPLVGRRDELADLEGALVRAAVGRGVTVLISGEAGIGKSRLEQEFRLRRERLAIIAHSCHELESLTPYGSLRPMLEQAYSLLPENLLQSPKAWLRPLLEVGPPGTHRLPGVRRRIDPRSISQAILLDSFCALVEEICRCNKLTPLVLVLDDLHWADKSTWEFLAQLSHRAVQLPLLIIGLCRMEDLPAERNLLIRTLERNELLLPIPLGLLNKEESDLLAGHLLADLDPSQVLLERLFHETEGNPLFLVETIRALRDASSGQAAKLGAVPDHELDLPLRIQRVIQGRLDHLDPLSSELLGTAASIGQRFNAALLREVSQRSGQEIVAALETWLRRGLVRELGEGYEFSHAKIREAAAATLSQARSQHVHRRIALVLEATVPPAEPALLAHYYARSDRPDLALPHYARAGEEALQLRSYHEAAQFGMRAINLLGRDPSARHYGKRIEFNLQLAQAYAYTGQLARALELLNETELLATSPAQRQSLGVVYRHSSQIYWLNGQPEEARDYALRAFRCAEDDQDASLCQAALRMLSRVSIARSAFDDAIAYLQRYLQQVQPAGSHPELPTIHGYLGVAYAHVGSWQRAFDHCAQGLQISRAGGSATLLDFSRMQLAYVHAIAHNWEECAQALPPQDAYLERLEALTSYGFMILSLHGWASCHLGKLTEAENILRTALDWASRANHRVFHYMPRIYLTECLMLARRLDEAKAQAGQAMLDARAAGDRWSAGIVLRLLAEIEVLKPQPVWARLEDQLIESMYILRQVRARPDLARTYLALRRLYDRAGQSAWAVDCHFRATSIFEELGMKRELAEAQGRSIQRQGGAAVISNLRLQGPNKPRSPEGSHSFT